MLLRSTRRKDFWQVGATAQIRRDCGSFRPIPRLNTNIHFYMTQLL
jgi:hypothetical protein